MTGGAPIYLDYNASTPLAPEAVAAMRAMLEGPFGNPSSGHWAGRPAQEAVERARSQVAGLLACRPDEVIFTSGGSEANNHALKGAWFAAGRAGAHIVTTRIEHPAVLDPVPFSGAPGRARHLCAGGWLRPRGPGRYPPRPHAGHRPGLRHARQQRGGDHAACGRNRPHRPRTRRRCSIPTRRSPWARFPCGPGTSAQTSLSIAGHKLYAPKGVGALYIRAGVKLEPLVHGAGHEAGRRAGTENVLLDAALGAACQAAQAWLGMPAHPRTPRPLLGQAAGRAFDGLVLNGHPPSACPTRLNVSFPGKSGSAILDRIPELAASTGSACHSGQVTLSPVLAAMGVPPETGMGAIRFSLGRGTTTAEEVERAAELQSAPPAKILNLKPLL